MNVSGDSTNASNSVDFYYDEGDGWEEISTGVTGSSDGDYWTVNGVDGNLGTVEDLELKANFSSSPDYGDTATVTLDKGGPDSFQLNAPEDYTNDEDPTVEVEVTDDYSGVQNISVSVEDSNNDEVDSTECDSTTTCELDLSDLSNAETYDVEVSSFDKVGNQNSDTLSFTVDTTEPNPDNFVMREDDEDGDEIEETDYDVEGENEFSVYVEFDASSNHESEVTGNCLVNGDEEDSSTLEALNDGDSYDFTCDIDDEYFDGDVDFEVDLADEAGNDWTSDSVTFGLDESDPTVSSVESVSGLGVFNSDFDVSYEAFDSVSEIDQSEYFFDESTDEGEGSEVSDGEFTVDTSDLDEGEHELFVRVQDGVGKWSETDSFTFDFYPDEEPEGSLNVAESLNVTSGSTEDLEVEIENTGVILVPSGTVSVSSFGSNESFESVAPEESTTVDVELSPGEDDLGENTLSVELDGVNASAEVDVLVKASGDVQDDIESDLDDYASDYENLGSRVESLRSELSQERKDRLDSDFSELESSVQEAQDAVDNGEYYMAEEIVSDLESQMQSVEETYSTVEEEQRIDNRNTLIGLGLGLFLLLIASGVGFVAYSDEYELDISALQDLDVPAIGNIEEEEEDSGYSHSEEEDQSDEGLVDKIKSKIDELKGGEESEDEGPEYEFK